MEELFIWLACHQDVTIKCSFFDTGEMPYSEDYGNVSITMLSDWTQHKVIVNVDLMLAAQNSEDYISSVLDNMYRELLQYKRGVLKDAIKKVKELPDGYKK